MLATIINQTIDTLMSVLHCYGAKLPQKFNVDNVFQTFFADFNKKVLIVPVFVCGAAACKKIAGGRKAAAPYIATHANTDVWGRYGAAAFLPPIIIRLFGVMD